MRVRRKHTRNNTNKRFQTRNEGNVTHLKLIEAVQLSKSNRLKEAQNKLRKVLKSDPTNLKALEEQARIYLKQGRFDRAEGALAKLLNAKPEHYEALRLMGISLRKQRKTDAAIATLRQAISVKLNEPEAYYSLGNLLKDKGDINGAIIQYYAALSQKPDFTPALKALAMIKTFTSHDADYQRLANFSNILASTDYTPVEKIELSQALGKVHDDLGEYDEAFKHHHRANTLRRKSYYRYDVKRDTNKIAAITNYFDETRLDALNGNGHSSRQMIFMVSMPKAGEDSVRDILEQYPGVKALEEKNLFFEAMREVLGDTFGPAFDFETQKRIKDKDLKAIGSAYLKRIPDKLRNAEYIIDTMTANYKWIGLIAAVFPNAKIIHCTRNALDTCFDIYTSIHGVNMPWLYDQKELAEMYLAYDEMMKHWLECLPQRIFTVDYETLIDDSAEEVSALLTHCALTGEPIDHQSVLGQRTDRSWHNYADHLSSMRNVLDQAYRGVIEEYETDYDEDEE